MSRVEAHLKDMAEETTEPVFLDMAKIIIPGQNSIAQSPENVVFEDPSQPEDCEEPGDQKQNQRFEWNYTSTKKLLATVDENESDLFSASNKKSVWGKIGSEMRKVNSKITGDKCRERYYTLKKKVTESLSQRVQRPGTSALSHFCSRWKCKISWVKILLSHLSVL